jgi:hypothetical protein
MSLEDAIYRLAAATEQNAAAGAAGAVSEIIRQRDQALSDLKQVTANRDWHQLRADENRKRAEGLAHRVRSLRGVVTRTKRRQAALRDAWEVVWADREVTLREALREARAWAATQAHAAEPGLGGPGGRESSVG